MLKYETFLIRPKGNIPQNTNYQKSDEYKHGIAISGVFATGENGKPLFVVKSIAHQKRLNDDVKLHEMECESIFILDGSKQDFIDANFDFFERLLLLGLAHLQGLSCMAFPANGFNFNVVPDRDCKWAEQIIMERKNSFISDFFDVRKN